MAWVRIESGAYWCVFVAAFLSVAIWESFRPRRDLSIPTARRWGNHALLSLTCSVISMLVLRSSPVILAAAVVDSRFGLLNKPWSPLAGRCILAVVLLDLVKYVLHRGCHSAPLLWRAHQVHHSDPDLDLSTTLRVHPIELILTQGGYLGVIVVLAPPLVAVLFAELASVALGFFGHANACLPEWLEKPVRRILVTPEMHRIHHSEEIGEQASNFGDIFPWWDRLFGTYVPAPAAGQDAMITGLKGFQNDRSLDVGFMLGQPFISERQRSAVPENTRRAGQ